jgi:ribose transport system permease protein
MNSIKQKIFSNYAWLGISLFVVLFVINLIILPNILAPRNIITTLAVAAPLVLACMAATPSILSGGVDISTGVTLGFINVAIFRIVTPMGIVDNPILTIVVLLLIGAAIGAVNGVLTTVIRLQPIVATLGTFLFLGGLSTYLMPTPGGVAPDWLKMLGGYIGPVPGPLIVVVIPILLWVLLTRLPYYKALMATGGDERAAFSSGLSVTKIRITAYIIGGILAAIAGIALTAMVNSGDATLGVNYTLIAIAGTILGGTSFAGGRGGMLGAVFGALDIFIIQKLLSSAQVNVAWFQIAYGIILILALIASYLLRPGAVRNVGA